MNTQLKFYYDGTSHTFTDRCIIADTEGNCYNDRGHKIGNTVSGVRGMIKINDKILCRIIELVDLTDDPDATKKREEGRKTINRLITATRAAEAIGADQPKLKLRPTAIPANITLKLDLFDKTPLKKLDHGESNTDYLFNIRVKSRNNGAVDVIDAYDADATWKLIDLVDQLTADHPHLTAIPHLTGVIDIIERMRVEEEKRERSSLAWGSYDRIDAHELKLILDRNAHRGVKSEVLDLSGATVEGLIINIGEYESVDLSEAKINRCTFTGEGTIIAPHAKFHNCEFSGMTVIDQFDFAGAELVGCGLRNLKARCTDSLTMASLIDVSEGTIVGCDFTGSVIDEFDLSGTEVYHCTFTGATIYGFADHRDSENEHKARIRGGHNPFTLGGGADDEDGQLREIVTE